MAVSDASATVAIGEAERPLSGASPNEIYPAAAAMTAATTAAAAIAAATTAAAASTAASTAAVGGGDIFVINVGGVRFETRRNTLLALPGSRLANVGSLGRRHEAYREQQDDYFFDRHPGAFDAVLQYYRCGALHAHPGVCGSLLKREFDFWGIDCSAVERCCWDTFNSSVSAASDFVKLDKLFADIEHPNEAAIAAMSVFNRVKTKVWLTLEAPSYSRLAKAYLGITTIFTILSIGVFFAESHDELKIEYCCNRTEKSDNIPSDAAYVLCDSSQLAAEQNSSLVLVRTDFVPVLRYVDFSVYSFFLFDFILRAALSQRRKQFATSPSNIVDLVCIISQTIAITERHVTTSAHIHAAASLVSSSTQWVRTFRLLRIFKILRHSVMVKVLAYTLLTAFRELIVVLIVLLTFVTLFGSIAYYVEPTTFPTITYGCWWSVVTLTTVGYGDVTPKTTGGYILGCVCALCGVFSVSFTVPIVVSNFNTYYSHARSHRDRKSEPAAKTPNTVLGVSADSGRPRRPIQLTSYAKVSSLDGAYSSKNPMAKEAELSESSAQQPHALGHNGFRTADMRDDAITSAYLASPWGYNYGFVSGDEGACQFSGARGSNETIR